MKGAAEPTFIHYAGKTDDFILFIDDIDQYKEWIKSADSAAAEEAGTQDKGTDFVAPPFVTAKDQLFLTHKQGAQGKKDTASKAAIAAEFDPESTIGKDSSIKNLAVKTILLKGRLMEQEFPERQGSKNDADGAMVAH